MSNVYAVVLTIDAASIAQGVLGRLREISTGVRNTSQLLVHFTRKPNKPLVVQVMHTSLVRIPAKVREVELMKILLAVDGSPCSDVAVEEIAARPWPDKSFVKVLTAYELPAPPTPEAWAVPLTYFDDLDVALRQQANAVVERAIQTLKSRLNKTIALDGAVVPGSPRVVILDEAEDWGADLIVVGSHGYRAWERFLLGSVSQSVVSHAKCSVEVVRCRRADEQSKKQNTLNEKQ